jgi:hypothetical protein
MLKRVVGLVSCSVTIASLISLVACGTPATSTAETKVTIGNILANPAKYEGQKVTLNGEYRGWEGGYGSPPVTRSDWVLKDSTGGIYVTGQSPTRYDPNTDRGRSAIVTGVVKTKDGKPFIEAQQIR